MLRSIFVCLILLYPIATFAQSTFGTILGTVRDNSGAVVPRAGVKLTDTDENTTRETSTDGNGDGKVHLSVRDHGSGIRAEEHRQLFEQFFTTKEHGLGMGLAIVRSIVESHGGKIDAENVADGGARFHFTLSMAKPAGRLRNVNAARGNPMKMPGQCLRG